MVTGIVFAVLYGIWLIAAIKYNRISILLLPFFFPLYLFRINIAGVPLYFIEGLIVISAVPVFINILRGRDEQLLKQSFAVKVLHLVRNIFKPKHKPIMDFLKSPFLPIVLFLIACVISAFIVPAESSKQALGILKSWVIVPLIYFVLLYHTVKSTKDLNITLYAYLGSSAFLCLWGLFQALSGSYITIDNRVSGPFESANYLAMYITPAFVFTMVQFLRAFIHAKFESADIKWGKFESGIYVGILVAIFLSVLVLTQSYGAILGSFIAIFIYIIYERVKITEPGSKKFLNRFIAFVLMVFVLGGGLAVVLNNNKFQNLTKLDEHTSMGTRIEIWKVGAGLLKESPILGIGLGQYEKKYIENAERILGKAPFEPVRLHSHNLYMEFWLQSGILGLISFIWVTILAYRQIYKNFNPDEKKMLIALLIMLTYILIHGIIDVTFWKNDLALIFWMIFAGVFALGKERKVIS
jgi:O-antigen ligase